METAIAILSIVVLALGGLLVFQAARGRGKDDLQGQIDTRMDSAHRAVGEVRQALGELSKSTEQVFEIGKSISGLEKILSAPKLRGGLGEFFLGDLLSQCLPSGRYELQYGFSDGARGDAVIRLNEGLGA